MLLMLEYQVLNVVEMALTWKQRNELNLHYAVVTSTTWEYEIHVMVHVIQMMKILLICVVYGMINLKLPLQYQLQIMKLQMKQRLDSEFELLYHHLTQS